MFGYVQTDSDELKIREYRLYKAYYCGLCRTLQKKYGFLTKFLLNYDCTFAAILLSLLKGSTKTIRSACTVNPLRRMSMADITPETEFAATLNVVLAYNNLLDKWQDDRNIFAGILALIYRPAYNKAGRACPAMTEAVENALLRLHDVEAANRADIDEAADCSAQMLSGAVAAYDFADDVTAHIAGKMCADIGRWIYIADAWADRKKDAKSSSYNPVNLSQSGRDEVMHLLYTSLCGAKDAYDLLDKDERAPSHAIIDNILCRGCVSVTEKILADEYNTKQKRRKNGSI